MNHSAQNLIGWKPTNRIIPIHLQQLLLSVFYYTQPKLNSPSQANKLHSILFESNMSFTFVAFAYLAALILTALLIFFAIWHIIAFDELKNDHKNPIEQCKSLNPLIIPEYATHAFINLLFLLGGQWFTLFLNMPLIAFHINKFRNRPVMSGFGIYDPTSIMNAQALNSLQREGWIKLGFYVITFFYYLYGMIAELIRD
ncbi:unnamed protein product [Adineta ricciae]|uniref:Cornichon-like protein n=1 Tax=Adineta ricciae TaxID=249248 RepID=A0A814ZAF6_ADIRI|nr:unnamed protein product [Adineta ricciae]